MDINLSNVKEISLLSEFKINNKSFKEMLRVSSGWISFSRSTGTKELEKWSFQTNLNDYKSKWENLISSFYHEVNAPHNYILEEMNTKFNVRITLKNDSKIDISCNGDFYLNGLINQAKAFLSLIPLSINDLPYVLAPFYFKDLNKNTLSSLNIDDVNALMYAEGGAMGRAGVIELVDKNLNLYVAETLYNESCDITQMEVTNLFEGFSHRTIFNKDDFHWVKLNNTNWLYLYLGMGNHLYIRQDFYLIYGDRLFDITQPNRYRKWCNLIRY